MRLPRCTPRSSTRPAAAEGGKAGRRTHARRASPAHSKANMEIVADSRRIDLWCTYISEIRGDSPWSRYEALLSADERARKARFLFAKDQRRYLVTRALVRTVLSRYAAVRPQDWAFRAGPHGRPAISAPWPAPALEFNVSHSADLVILGITSGRALGIDAESAEARAADIDGLDRYFAPEESAALLSLPPHAR